MSEKKACSKCGATLAEDAAFCSNCGAPVASTAAQPPPTPPRREYRREKEEKQEKGEKYEKREKAEKEEKVKGGDRTGAIVGGLVLIWLGLSFYLSQTNVIPWANWWAYFLSGLGVIVILSGLIRYSQNGYPLTGSLIGGAVLLAIGLMFIMEMRDFWPIVLVVIGVAIIVSSITARSRAPKP